MFLKFIWIAYAESPILNKLRHYLHNLNQQSQRLTNKHKYYKILNTKQRILKKDE